MKHPIDELRAKIPKGIKIADEQSTFKGCVNVQNGSNHITASQGSFSFVVGPDVVWFKEKEDEIMIRFLKTEEGYKHSQSNVNKEFIELCSNIIDKVDFISE